MTVSTHPCPADPDDERLDEAVAKATDVVTRLNGMLRSYALVPVAAPRRSLDHIVLLDGHSALRHATSVVETLNTIINERQPAKE